MLGGVKNSQFITGDNTRNHCWVTCVMCQKFPDYTDSCWSILVSQLLGYSSSAHFCVIFSSKNALYSHVENFQTTFIYQQISNFMNCDLFSRPRKLRALYLLFHQSKRRLVDHVFHHRECFPTSPYGIRVRTNAHVFRHLIYTVHIL